MPPIDSYNAKTISVHFSWPKDVIGIERIMLSAQGDLQRLLSSFFARPITVALIYSDTTSPKDSNPGPTIQSRQVHLLCGSRVVCKATSTVRITSPECARLFLKEKYAIGQVFREVGKVPRFELVSVGSGPENDTAKVEVGKRQLWRKYLLDIEGFECEILEVFPDREMFVLGEDWLANSEKHTLRRAASIFGLMQAPSNTARLPQASVVLGVALLLALVMTLLFELLLFAGAREQLKC